MSLFKRMSKSGTVGVPIAVRRDLGMQAGDGLAMDIVDGEIHISPQNPRCIFCGKDENEAPDTIFYWYKGRMICDDCYGEVARHMKSEGGTQ